MSPSQHNIYSLPHVVLTCWKVGAGGAQGPCSDYSTTRARVVVALILLALAFASADCASRHSYRIAQVALVTSQALDLHSTHLAISAGAVEANPFLPTGWPAQVGVKSAETAALWWMGSRLAREHRTTATLILSAVAGAYAVIAARNYRLARELQP